MVFTRCAGLRQVCANILLEVWTNMLLTTREAADRLRMKEQTLAVWRLRGQGPRFAKIGAAVRYPEAEVDAFLAARMRGPAADGNGPGPGARP